MAIDFTKIVSGDDFELLCRDVLKATGAEIVSHPSVGPDGGKDIVINVKSEDILGTIENHKYVVQCKHYAISGKSVREQDLGDIRSVMDKNDAIGYILITSTMPSVTVEENFEAISRKGDYKTLIWDKKVLESKIDKLSNSIEIVERYNLRNTLESTFHFVNNILSSEVGLPINFKEIIDQDKLKILIYNREVFDSSGIKNLLIGYCCIDYKMNDLEKEEIKNKYNLSEIHIITSSGNKTKCSMSIENFYNHIQEYKDYWYQSNLLNYYGQLALNPTLIMIIVSTIKPLPYSVQEPLINFLGRILKEIPNKNNRFCEPLIIETCSAVSNLKIHSLSSYFIDIIKIVPDLKIKYNTDINAQLYLATLVERVIESLIVLEEDKLNYYDTMIELFSISSDLDYRMAFLEYFKKFKINIYDKELENLKEKYGDYVLKGKRNGMIYRNEGVTILENEANYTVARVIDEYFGNTDKYYGPIISYSNLKF